MKYNIVDTFPNKFFEDKKAPFISIYQKTSRTNPANKKDSLVFKNHIKEVETSLKEKYTDREIKPLMTMLTNLHEDGLFWRHTLDGLAIFATLDECIIYKLKKQVENLAVVANSFHIKPLIRYYQFAKTFQILDIDGNSFRILEGSPYHLEVIKLDDEVPTTIDEVLGTEKKDSYLTRGAYGGTTSSTFHGHGGRKAEIEIDLEKFLRQVDPIVYENISKTSKLPLILLAPAEYHGFYQEISKNQYLEKKSITGTYKTLGDSEVKEHIRKLVKIDFDKKITKLTNDYHESKAVKKGTDNVDEIIRAGCEGRIKTLLIERDRIIPGKIDRTNKTLISGELTNPKIDDILDDLAQLTLEKNGKVYILRAKDMPSKTGLAAIYRY